MTNGKKIISDIRVPPRRQAGEQRPRADEAQAATRRAMPTRLDIQQKGSARPQPEIRRQAEIRVHKKDTPIGDMRPPSVREPLERPARRKRRYALIGACVAIVAIVFVGFYLFSSLRLTLAVELKKTKFDLGSPGVKLTFPAKEFNASVVKRAQGTSRDIKKFNEKAHGVIVVYNNYNEESQVLLLGTRFTAPSGLVYRSLERVVVPGKVATKPGSVEVNVVADESGPKYNIGLTDFLIPGFIGGPKYQKFFGRSKTEMKGGAIGEGKVVGEAESGELLSGLENQARQEIRPALINAIEKDYISFSDTFELSQPVRVTDPPIGAPAESFFGEVRAQAHTLAVDHGTYANFLARALFKDRYEQGAQTLHVSSQIGFKDFAFDYETKTITATLTGQVVFEGSFDQEAFKKGVLELKKYSDLSDTFFAKYPAIARVKATFIPRFIKRIPSDPSRLTVTIAP